MELKHIRDFVLFKRSKEYEIAHSKELRINSGNSSISNFNSGMGFLGFTGGPAAFDYGYSTHNLGSALDEVEAKYIVETFKKRYRNL